MSLGQLADAPPAAGAQDAVPLVSLRGVTKRFGSLTANDRVSFDVPRGAILALVGENGAGKSTIMNALCGLYMPDEGAIDVDGSPLRCGSPAASLAAGIGMVHQQFRLVPTLTGFENVSLALHRGAFAQARAADAELRDLMRDLGFDIDLSALVWQMPLARRQQLEILRTIAAGARVLILDEPTSVLSPVETRGLFEIVRRIADSGRSVVLISHKLPEILGVADEIVAMRGGRVVHRGPAREIDAPALARHIVGERHVHETTRPRATPAEVVLRVEGLTVNDHRGSPVVRDAGFSLRRGELAALVGVTGNGQSELMEAIGGLRPAARGTIDVPRRGGRRAFGYIPAQHLGTGLAPGLNLAENAALGRQFDAPFGGWLSGAALARNARAVADRFGVAIDESAPVRRLSGGNLQRIVLGRELLADPGLILADYPTRGLDVASSGQIRAALIAAVERGAAVLMSSEELQESLAMATRILVMNDGRITADLAAEDCDLERIGRLITGDADA